MSSSTSLTPTPSPSGSASSSSTGTGSSTSFSSSTPTSAFVPASTVNPGSGVGDGPSNSGNNVGGNTLATSAPLYLYTFLATLVLLLSVSAAIVIRSFIVRRRHRLMVEEAIRNGTWVPPAPPGTGGRHRPHVDLSKKPQLWDAYLGGGVATFTPMDMAGGGKAPHYTSAWRMEAEGKREDWDNIKPVYAAYVTPPASPTATTATPLSSPQQTTTDNNTTTTSQTPNTVSASSRRPGLRAVASRMLHVLNPTPDPTSPLPPNHNSNANANNTTTTTTTNQNQPNNSDSSNNDFAMTQILSSSSPTSPAVVRVAVMIAMPSPPPHRHANSTHSSSGSGSGSGSSRSSTPNMMMNPVSTLTHPLQNSHPPNSNLDDDETPLPHIELGVAEIEVSMLAPDSSSNGGKSLRSTGSGSEEMEVEIDSPVEEVRLGRLDGR